jgi:hypothetical protein
VPSFDVTTAAPTSAASTASVNVPICGAASCTGKSFYITITGIPTANSVTVVNADTDVTLPSVFPVNDLSFCKLKITTAANYVVTGTVAPFGVDAAGAAVASGAVSRSCGFLVKAADNVSATSGQAAATFVATNSANSHAITYTFTAVTNTALVTAAA